MTVHVGEFVSSVTPEPEGDRQVSESKADWQRTAEMRDQLARLHGDWRRTEAENWDD